MRNIIWGVILLVVVARAQQEYKFCAPIDVVTESGCSALQRGDSQVRCLRVMDSAECAIRLAQGEAHFGIFNAEELLLTYQFYPNEILPILQLRHRDRQSELFEFETVAVTRTDLTQPDPIPGREFNHLKNGGFCHPGFRTTQWWNDYILKHFEKRVINSAPCQDGISVIENELKNLKNFFGKACRPGEWAAESSIDEELKKRYPELCALCDNPVACTYDKDKDHGHLGAVECLTKGRGKVAYVALSHVRDYLGRNESYQFLCPLGNKMPLSSNPPCSWLKQPWGVIAARKDIAEVLKSQLQNWLNISKTYSAEEWQTTLNKIIQGDKVAIDIGKLSISAYLSKGRDIDLVNDQTCDRTIRWCTIGDLETNKCNWVAKATMALGIEPRISCVKSTSTFQCFRDIAHERADIIVIDSNYGYLARTVYGLSTVLYSETIMNKRSGIIAVTREPKDDNFIIKSLQDIKGRKACFSEYGGIGWLSFINVARMNGIISSKSCDYPRLAAKLLSGACAPGIRDYDHSQTLTSTDVSDKLCLACRHRNDTSCSANETNPYYGDIGAMQCLKDGAGDIAFVEAPNIIDSNIDPYLYRILCKNGSLARDQGFNFDKYCPLSVTIDSEIVSRRNNSQTSARDIMLALLKMENWLGYRVNARRPIHIYDRFNGTLDLLFKDSASGLVSTSSTKESVLAYKELFSHIESCTNAAFTANANFIFIILVALYHLLSGHVH